MLSLILVFQPVVVFAAIPDDEPPFRFEENEKFKGKTKNVKVPKRPVVGVPGPIAVFTTLFGYTPMGEQLIDETAQVLEDIDYFLWDNLNMSEWPNAIKNGVISIGEGLGEFLSDTFFNYKELHYPQLHVLGPQYEFIEQLPGMNPTNMVGGYIFLKRAESETYYVAKIDLQSQENSRNRIRARITLNNNSTTNTHYSYYGGWKTGGNKDSRRERALEDANDTNYMVSRISFDVLPASPQEWLNYFKNNHYYYDQINKDELNEFERQINRHHFPYPPETHFPAIPESVPYLPNKPEINDISIIEIDGIPHIEINVPNPWFNPELEPNPETNPEELPYFSPVEVENPEQQPEWEPGYIPVDADGNPLPDNSYDPGTDPVPDPSPSPDPSPEPGSGGPGDPPDPDGIRWDKLKRSIAGVTTVFPFSLPWDAGRAFDAIFSGFDSDRPEWELPIGNTTFTIKLPEMVYDWLPFLHAVQIIIFDIGMIYAIRKLFGGTT